MMRKQQGATAIEFALVMPLFLMFLLGVIDFARMLYTWNAANEVTREGARYAVVCADPSSDAAVLARMQILMPQVNAITVEWAPAGCDAGSCEAVTVSLTDLDFTWISPIVGANARKIILLPGFSTYLQREMMSFNPKIC
jgi:Flp pilus assembly protein TadG